MGNLCTIAGSSLQNMRNGIINDKDKKVTFTLESILFCTKARPIAKKTFIHSLHGDLITRDPLSGLLTFPLEKNQHLNWGFFLSVFLHPDAESTLFFHNRTRWDAAGFYGNQWRKKVALLIMWNDLFQGILLAPASLTHIYIFIGLT